MSGLPAEAHPLSTAQRVYLWLSGLSVASLLIADVLGVKLFRIPLPFSFHVPWQNEPIDAVQHTCGMLTFPITFVLTDLINEYYGKRAARQIIWISFAMGGVSFLAMNIAIVMPHWDVPFNIKAEAFDGVFRNSRIMYVASLAAYLVGSLGDVLLFGWLKRATHGRYVWLRATGSTIISQMIDSFVVTWLAFSVGRRLFPGDAAPMTMGEVLNTAATGYLLKFVIAIGVTPVIYAGRWVMHEWLGMEPLPPE